MSGIERPSSKLSSIDNRLISLIGASLVSSFPITLQYSTGLPSPFGTFYAPALAFLIIAAVLRDPLRSFFMTRVRWGPVVVLLLLLLLSIFAPGQNEVSFSKIGAILIAIFSGLFACQCIVHPPSTKYIIASYLCVCVALSLLLSSAGVVQAGRAALSSDQEKFSQINAFGIALSIASVLAASMALQLKSTHKGWPVAMTIFSCLITSSGILLTGSRGALIGMLAGFVAVWWMSDPIDRASLAKATVLFGGTLLVVITVFFGRSEGILRQLSTFSELSGKLGGRSEVWRIASESHWSVWIFGSGYGGSAYVIGEKMGAPFAPHNLYLQILLDFGLLGAIVFLLLLKQSIAVVAKNRSVARVWIPIAVVVAISTMSLHYLLSPILWTLLLVGSVLPGMDDSKEMESAN